MKVLPTESTASGSPAPAGEPTCFPSVSVLIAAWNEAKYIEACLASLLAIDWPNLEILVAAGGDDETLPLACGFADGRVQVIAQLAGEGEQRALRRLLRLAHGEIIYLTDGDTIVPADTFHAMLAPLLEGEADVVSGTYRPHRAAIENPLVFYQWTGDRAFEPWRGRVGAVLVGANTVLTRQALDAVGGFEPEVAVGTDYHLELRLRAAGYVIHTIDAAVETEYADNLLMLFRRHSRWLRNVLHGPALGDWKTVGLNAMLIAFSATVVLWPLTWPWTRKRGVIAWFVWLGNASCRRANYARKVAKELEKPLTLGYFLRLPALTLLDFAANLWCIYDLLSPRRRWRW